MNSIYGNLILQSLWNCLPLQSDFIARESVRGVCLCVTHFSNAFKTVSMKLLTILLRNFNEHKILKRSMAYNDNFLKLYAEIIF